jgi:outer membrane lipoprotein SlyB
VREAKGDLISVTQRQPTPIAIGQKVLVIEGKQARIVPDYATAASDTPPAPKAEEKHDQDKPATQNGASATAATSATPAAAPATAATASPPPAPASPSAPASSPASAPDNTANTAPAPLSADKVQTPSDQPVPPAAQAAPPPAPATSPPPASAGSSNSSPPAPPS